MWVLRACCTILATVALATVAFGQSVISTHSGVVYYFDGTVYLDNQPLQPDPGRFPNMTQGAELRTEEGHAEVLLTPGVFLRVGENAEVRMLNDELANTQVELLNGSAILDSDEPASGTAVTLIFHDWQVRSEHAGTYRFDSEQPRLWVLKGEAEVVSSAGTKAQKVKVRDGMNLAFGADLIAETSTTEPNDDLTDWSNGRSQSIAIDDSVTQQIDNDPMTQTDPYGISHFPMLGALSMNGYSGIYGLATPIQPGFYSMYLPGYAYAPPLILFVNPSRGFRSFPPIRAGTPGVLPGTGIPRRPVVVVPGRPVVTPIMPHPVGPGAPVAVPHPGTLAGHPSAPTHAPIGARAHAAAGGHR